MCKKSSKTAQKLWTVGKLWLARWVIAASLTEGYEFSPDFHNIFVTLRRLTAVLKSPPFHSVFERQLSLDKNTMPKEQNRHMVMMYGLRCNKNRIILNLTPWTCSLNVGTFGICFYRILIPIIHNLDRVKTHSTPPSPPSSDWKGTTWPSLFSPLSQLSDER